MGKRPGLVVAAWVVGACNFGAPGGNDVQDPGALDEGTGGSEGATASGEADDDEQTGQGSGDGAATSETASADDFGDDANTNTETGDATDGPTTSTTSGVPGSGALIQLSDVPSYDFGPVAVLGSAEHSVTLTNVGDATATTITASALPVPFSYAGTGTCAGILDPGDSCTIVVVFSPAVIGLVAEALTVEWAGGDESVVGLGLTGGGAGTSSNLLQNPGGETAGSPPTPWAELSGGDWHTYDGSGGSPPYTGFAPHAGAQSIFAGTGGQTVFVLGQGVDVSPWAATIDASALQVNASAWIRTLDTNNNPGRVRITFIDAGGTALMQAQTDTYSGVNWQERSLDAPVPSGTRSILYELRCNKPAGETQCDAYFDDASLTVRYP